MSEDSAIKKSKSLLEKTLGLFELNKIDRDIYSWTGKNVGWARIFGGQVMAQTLIAAYKTVKEDHHAHSFHSYFLRPGQMDKPIIFTVDRIRDGKSFTTRNVKAIQEGEAIFSCSISFQKYEKGFEHQIDMPDVPMPESLLTEYEIRQKISSDIDKDLLPMFLKKRELQMKPVEEMDYLNPEKKPPYRRVWLKPEGGLPKDPVIHKAFLLYASDMGLIATANYPHGVNFLTKNIQMASLDHAMWFHKEIDFNDWLLYAIDSPASGNSRGFSRGSIYTKSGELIASCTQEGLIRLWPE